MSKWLYCRKIAYLHCANDTVLALFMNGVRESGLSMSMGEDENVSVAIYVGVIPESWKGRIYSWSVFIADVSRDCDKTYFLFLFLLIY